MNGWKVLVDHWQTLTNPPTRRGKYIEMGTDWTIVAILYVGRVQYIIPFLQRNVDGGGPMKSVHLCLIRSSKLKLEVEFLFVGAVEDRVHISIHWALPSIPIA